MRANPPECARGAGCTWSKPCFVSPRTRDVREHACWPTLGRRRCRLPVRGPGRGCCRRAGRPSADRARAARRLEAHRAAAEADRRRRRGQAPHAVGAVPLAADLAEVEPPVHAAHVPPDVVAAAGPRAEVAPPADVLLVAHAVAPPDARRVDAAAVRAHVGPPVVRLAHGADVPVSVHVVLHTHRSTVR